MINALPPLRELDLTRLPYWIRDGQLRHLETLRVCYVEDWNSLVREATASLRCLHLIVSHGSFSWLGRRDDTDLCPQELGHNSCLHITKFTNLVSLFIGDIDTWMDRPVSFLAMLSNLAHLETLHLYSSIADSIDIVSPI